MWKRSWIKRGNGPTDWLNGRAERTCRRRSKTENQNGLAEGKIEIAKNLINIGMKVEDIIKVTGLSKEEIEKISKDK